MTTARSPESTRGRATGADLTGLLGKAPPKVTWTLRVDPSLDTTNVRAAQRYRFITYGTWAFMNYLKRPLQDPHPVRVDVCAELRRMLDRLPQRP